MQYIKKSPDLNSGLFPKMAGSTGLPESLRDDLQRRLISAIALNEPFNVMTTFLPFDGVLALHGLRLCRENFRVNYFPWNTRFSRGCTPLVMHSQALLQIAGVTNVKPVSGFRVYDVSAVHKKKPGASLRAFS